MLLKMRWSITRSMCSLERHFLGNNVIGNADWNSYLVYMDYEMKPPNQNFPIDRVICTFPSLCIHSMFHLHKLMQLFIYTIFKTKFNKFKQHRNPIFPRDA